jgi:hypothetical protein
MPSKCIQQWNKAISDTSKKEEIINSLQSKWQSTCTRVVLFEKTNKRYKLLTFNEEEQMKFAAERFLFITTFVGDVSKDWNAVTNLKHIPLKDENELITSEDLSQIYEMFY